MTRSRTRRTSLTIAVASAVAFGAVALAPAASAATDSAEVDGGYTVVDKINGNGPDAFLITENGRKPIFFCDEDEPNQRHTLCQGDPNAGTRF